MRGVISAARRRPGAGGQAIAAELANRRVFQRSGTSAVIPLSGTYTGTAGAIQARIVDASSSAEVVTWTTVAASPTGGTWSGTMTVPQGGWYKVQTRFLSNPTGIAAAANQFGVGDIWMMAGQSQQARMSTLSSSPPTFDPKSVYFNGSVWEFPGTLAGTNGNGGIRFLNLMVANTGVPQALIQASVEGTSIVDWEASDTAYTNARAQLVAAGAVAGILWHQGGTGIGVVTRSDYKTRLLDLKTRFATAASVLNFGVFPLMHRTTATDTDLNTQETRRAHYEYISENPGTVNLGWTPAVPLADDVHQTAAGSEVIAYAYANAMLNKLGVVSTNAIGPSITGVTRSGAVLTLTVQHTSGSSLKINSGTQATGFQVLLRDASFSDASALAISSITLGTNTITITLASVPEQEVDVYYQYGRFDNTSPVFDNTTVLGQTTGLALQPLMAPVQSGVSTQALKFDNTTGYVSYPLNALWNFADADWTVGAWYSIDDPAGTSSQYLVSTGPYGALQTFNLFVYEAGATGAVQPGMIEANVRGSGTAIQVVGPTNSAHLDTAWRLITVERIKATETLNIYVTPANGSRTLYHSASVAGLGAITPTVATNLATRAPATTGSARWLNGGLYSVFKMTGTLTASETQAIASGSDIVTHLGKTPQIYTKLDSLTSPIANSGSGGTLPATIQGGVTLKSGPVFAPANPTFQEASIPVPDANAWYVATTGSDAAAGTQAAPFLTVAKAVDSATASGTRKNIFIRGGTYRFTNHIYLAASAANLNVFGYPGETAVISGGEVVTGFVSEGNGLYSATVPGGATSLDLVIGGERQRCAQSGTFDPTDPYRSGWLIADPVAVGSETTTQFKYRGTDLGTVTANTGMMAYVLEGGALRATSVDILKSVTSVNTTTKVVTLSATTAGASPIYNGSNYKLLNHPAFIRNDGEFAWRASDSKLVIRPKSANFASLGVVVPRGPSSGNFFQMDAGANNVTFGNLTFADLPYTGSAFLLYGATGARVGGCTFRNVGNAVIINAGNNAVIAGNEFRSIADAGIVLTTNVLGTKVYANAFKDIGLIHKGGSAIYHGGASNSTIAYNDFFGMSRYSVSFKGAATQGHVHHTCRNNYIGRTNRETPDTGAIEFLNRNRVTFNAVVSSNYIEDAGGFALTDAGVYEDRKYASCVYLDDLSSFVTISKNFMKGAAWGHVFIHGGDDNTIENNFSILEAHETFANTMHINGNLTGDVNPERNKFQKNIYYATTNRTGQMWNLGSLGAGNVIDNNILFNIPKLGANSDPTSTNDVGFDTNSVVADPLFADVAAGDYRLQGSSPAFAKGIVNLDWPTMGKIGYTYAAATADTLPRFWKTWASSPILDLNYLSRPSLHRVETFARPSAATYINSRGVRVSAAANEYRVDFSSLTMEPRGLLLEPATTNLLANSGDFTNALWAKTNATASTGGGTGLDGTNSLSVLTKTTEQGGSLQYVNPFPAGSHLTATVFLKKGASMDWASIELTDNSFASGKTVWFNLATGTAGAAPTGGTTMTYVSHGITPMGKGIYKCTLTVLCTLTNTANDITDASLQIKGDVADGNAGGGAYWGVIGGTTLLGGAQVEARSSATSFVSTTSGIITRAAETLDIPLAAGTYDVLITDAAGSETRTGQSPSGGLYRVTPRSGQDHISRVQVLLTGQAPLQSGFTTEFSTEFA